MSQNFSSVDCVIPTHGRPILLEEALMSVLAQSLSPVNIFVVDDLNDHLTETSVKKVRKRTKIPIHYIPAKPEPHIVTTAGRSRNIGASHSEAQLLAFLDDDDLWEPDFLRSLSAALDESNKDFSVCNTDIIRGDWRGPSHIISSDWGADTVLSSTPGLSGSNFIIRKQVFNSIEGFDPSVRVANDWDFSIRLTLNGFSPCVVNTALVIHRAHDQGQLTAPSESRARALEEFMIKHESNLTSHGKKHVRRQIHAVRRVSSTRPYEKLFHLFMQIALDDPKRLFQAIASRMKGKPRIYR